MSATHIGIASAAAIPESLAIMSHFDACVPRRSITRSKSNIGTVAPALACGASMRFGFKLVGRVRTARGALPQQHRIRAVHSFRAVGHRLLQRARLHGDV